MNKPTSLRLLRFRAGMSLEVLAGKLGLHHSTLSLYERGLLRVPVGLRALVREIVKAHTG